MFNGIGYLIRYAYQTQKRGKQTNKKQSNNNKQNKKMKIYPIRKPI